MRYFKRYILSVVLLLAISFSFASTTGKLAGRVKNSEGKALGYVNVMVYEDGKRICGVQTKENGIYMIIHIPPGEYTVRYQLVSYTPVEIHNVKINLDQTTTQNATLTIKSVKIEHPTTPAKGPLTAEELISLEQDSLRHLRGREDICYTIYPTYFLIGKVKNTSGKGIRNAEVKFVHKDGSGIAALTGKRGSFKLRYKTHNRFHEDLVISAAGYEDYILPDFQFEQDKNTRIDVKLEKSHRLSSMGMLTGRLTYITSKSAANRDIIITHPFEYATSVKTDEEGIYVIPDLPTGKYDVIIKIADHKQIKFKGIHVKNKEIRTFNYQSRYNPEKRLMFDKPKPTKHRKTINKEQTGSIKKVYPDELEH